MLYQLSYVHHRSMPAPPVAPREGFEPPTQSLEGSCSIQLSYRGVHAAVAGTRRQDGRGRGIRTPDILLPKQARYQTALYPADPATRSGQAAGRE